MILRALLMGGLLAMLPSGATTAAGTPAGAERVFSLIDQHGKPVSDADFHGQWLVVYFGFTQCPDVCPVTLTVLAAALRMLGTEAARVEPVFITIDPEQDTPQVLNSYLKNFGPNFIGLTGSAAQIARAAQSFGAYSTRSAKAESAATALAHSSTLYVVDPQGRLSRQLSSQMTAAQLSTYLRKALRSESISGTRLNEGS